MTDEHEETTPGGGSDGLWRWLVGGLLGGLVILGLLVAAYTIGNNRGQDEARATAPAPTEPAATAPPSTATTAPPTTAAPSETAPIEVTPALVAAGKTLFTDDGCAACHSLNGTAGAGPSLQGAAGRMVELEDGTTVTADDAYLEQSITEPDAEIVKGFSAGIMSAAIASHKLATKPDDVRALVAFVKAQSR